MRREGLPKTATAAWGGKPALQNHPAGCRDMFGLAVRIPSHCIPHHTCFTA